VMSCISKIFVILMTLFFILALGCIQELERPNVMTDTITPTATPVVIVKYLERPTIIPSELPTVSPTAAPTIVPASAPAPTANPADSIEWLEIIEPKDDLIVRENVLVVHGTAYPGSEITVNDSNVVTDEKGQFWKGIMLKTGENTINVVAKIRNNVNVKVTRHVTLRSRQPIFLSVREPLSRSLALTQTIPVSGLTTPDAKITVQSKEVEVKVREVPDLPVQELGVFNTEITLTIGTNNIQIVASNAVGQRIQTDLIVAYLP